MLRPKLIDHCQITDRDSPSMVVLKDCVRKWLQDEFVVSPSHLAAFCLFPRKKQMTKFSENERKSAYDYVRKELSRFTAPNANQNAGNVAKRTKSSELFEDFDDEIPVESKDELELYLNLQLGGSDDVFDDPLKFWKKYETMFPKLSKAAKFILSVPASNTSAERSFSLMNYTVNEKRTNLSSSAVDDLAFLKSNK